MGPLGAWPSAAWQGFHAGRHKSGIGGADGKHGLYEFTQIHVVYLQTLRSAMRRPA
jgi:acyl-CoA reductase-like NAD-dependent aldehyde dehydrogenase